MGQITRDFRTDWLKATVLSVKFTGRLRVPILYSGLFEVVYHAIINTLEIRGTSKDYGPTYLRLCFQMITLINVSFCDVEFSLEC